jgi:hypothetical protein
MTTYWNYPSTASPRIGYLLASLDDSMIRAG